jgi:hypothetical protein
MIEGDRMDATEDFETIKAEIVEIDGNSSSLK